MSTNQKVLVVYYSYSGHTRTVGREIAQALGADSEEIVDAQPKKGLAQIVAWIRSANGQLTKICPPQKNPARYDLVVIGSPVHGGKPASPVSTYLAEQQPHLGRVAFFVTSASHQNARTLVCMGEILGKTPEATLGVPGSDLRSGAFRDQVAAFCAKLAR